MPFQATIKEIDNGFTVGLSIKLFQYEENYYPTIEGAIAAIITSYMKHHAEELQEKTKNET
jgi:hypothetical protein